MPGEHAYNRDHVVRFLPRRNSLRLVTCSVCLRVWEDGAWVEASEVIRRLHTFEREDVVRLAGALCQQCETGLRLRRERDCEQLAA